MNRKVLGIMMASVLAFSMVGCGNSTGTEAKGEGTIQEGTEKWKPKTDITIRVPVGGGGAFDIFTRIFAGHIQSEYGKTVMVTNLAGANGGVAAADLMQYDAAAEEMMGGNIGMFTIAPLFTPDNALNLDDYEIVTSLVSEEYVLCTSVESGITTYEDLIEYGKENNLLVASKGPGGSDHALVTALFGDEGVNFNVVSADTANQLLLSTISGDTDVAIVSTSVAEQFVLENSVVPVLCFSKEDCKEFEGLTVPTAVSKGHETLVFRTNNFIMTRKGANEGVVDQIFTNYKAWQETEEFKELANKSNFIPFTEDGKTTRATIEAAAEMFTDIFEEYYQK